ncbi:phage minor head protein [Riemerella anatipestifer]|uniref:phage head morphogenesis protein n=1 Tax=Riemerella anatipestifer TaxID=34085 RepID=UPI00129DB5C0|nr:phage minor head protein [Riemerella anatipestifer]
MHLSHNNDQPDWADLLAKDWLDTIRGIYKEKTPPKDGFSTEIVKKTGKELSTAVDKGYIFKGVDYDTPDYIAREVLKQNVWKFSVAKNYNDCIRLNNLLLRPDGSIRPWHEFKREAMMIVGMSNRYLKTEYDTIVAGAMMSRKWQEIQRDKHIFPFVKFVVTMDDHTSEICTPLSGVIVSVDDPFLQQYFPPNHFNCRTDVIKLRNAEPTPQRLLPYIDIPKAFLNNVGATGEIFTEENRYIANTPEEVLEKGIDFMYLERYSNVEFKKVYLGKGMLHLFTNGSQTKQEFSKNKNALSVLVEKGKNYKMLPIIDDGATNPDAFNYEKLVFSDIKVAITDNGKNALQNGLKEASKQGAAELILHLTVPPKSYIEMYKALRLSLIEQRNKNVKYITIIFPNKQVKEYDLLSIKKKLKLK